ncbi:hypothetical protein P2R12_23220 [Cytobacillus oceanisediminis]|uniref:hypothetical protein n=1 Tax=Cytobacillus oceanisediminis TaxID=665099 RepID=UPI0023DA1863|nr:hypothetical protein [Cytobacillus oceanisediminis]MDF2039856.1 hypothetical protein [Cytobacillus oceanisediminis]
MDKYNFSNLSNAVQQAQRSLSHQMAELAEIQNYKALKEEQRIQREVQLNEMIQQIVANTAYLPEMVGLIRKNNEINEEMLGLFQEMTEVLKAQTVEEAEGIVKSVVGKAQETNDALDAMSGLLSYGKLLIKLMFPES